MRNYKTIQVTEKEVTDIICDRCGRIIKSDPAGDIIEWQEFQYISFIGGYGSVFGDNNEITCDLCQHCLWDLIGKFCYVNGDKPWWTMRNKNDNTKL